MKVIKLAVGLTLLAVLVMVGASAFQMPISTYASEAAGPYYPCDDFNYSDDYTWMGLPATAIFRAGERITLAADYGDVSEKSPALMAASESYIFLAIDGVLVRQKDFPGTITYTFTDETVLDGEFPVIAWGYEDESVKAGPERVKPGFIQWTTSCETPVAGESAPEPGCDMLIDIPQAAVVGTLVNAAPMYYAPGELVEPYSELAAGKTAWALGIDATGAYTKIVWACSYLWVPTSSIGPNYDAVWNGMALPTSTVQ